MADEGGESDSWEDQADSGAFDKRLDDMEAEIQQSVEKKAVATGEVVPEESAATQYQPKVRILKRDTNAPPPVDNKSMSSGAKSKSLQQREAEYAEARQRIFGPDAPEDLESLENGDVKEEQESQGMPKLYQADELKQVPVIRQPKGPDGSFGFNKPDDT